MILVINNQTKHLKLLLAFIKRHKIPYKLRNFRRITLKAMKQFDAIILTGGPEAPLESKYSKGMSIIKKSKKPVFGICLGFQLICKSYSSVIKKMRRVDGIRSIKIRKRNSLFNNCPRIMKVSKHNEFFVEKVGKELEILAVSKNNIEAVKHKKKLIYGVQFHPEIKWRNDGYKCLENFLKMIS